MLAREVESAMVKCRDYWSHPNQKCSRFFRGSEEAFEEEFLRWEDDD